jgi:hypothetical protein
MDRSCAGNGIVNANTDLTIDFCGDKRRQASPKWLLAVNPLRQVRETRCGVTGAAPRHLRMM